MDGIRSLRSSKDKQLELRFPFFLLSQWKFHFPFSLASFEMSHYCVYIPFFFFYFIYTIYSKLAFVLWKIIIFCAWKIRFGFFNFGWMALTICHVLYTFYTIFQWLNEYPAEVNDLWIWPFFRLKIFAQTTRTMVQIWWDFEWTSERLCFFSLSQLISLENRISGS